MKTAKLVVGIISMVVFIFIVFQSCTAGVVNALEDNTEDASGGGGIILAICVLIGGIVGVATRNSKGGGITSGVFYLLGSIIGFANLGTYTDLVVWSVMALLFAILFFIGSFTIKKKDTQDNNVVAEPADK